MNQSTTVASEPMAIQPAQIGGATGYIISCSSHHISDFFEGSNRGVQFIALPGTQYSFPYLREPRSRKKKLVILRANGEKLTWKSLELRRKTVCPAI